MKSQVLVCVLAVVLAVALTQAPVCQNCEGRDGRDRDPVYCDRYYNCHSDGTQTLKSCPAGTFFDDYRGCNHIDNVTCPLLPCGPGDVGSRSPSGVCCNKYFQCSAAGVTTQLCPIGEIYSAASSSCVTSADPVKTCADLGMYYCDVDLRGPLATACTIKPDPRGDPCFFQLGSSTMLTPQGTFWDANTCALGITAAGTDCDKFFQEGINLPLAAVCSATFRATFDTSLKEVISERDNSPIFVYSVQQGTQLANRAVTFDTAKTSFLYYYRFISNEFQENTAFRIRFRPQTSSAGSVTYDLLSNNYCPQCPETISFTTRRVSATSQEVDVTFVPESGPVVTSSATIDVTNTRDLDLLEATVIFGVTSVSGQLSRLDPNNPDGQAVRTVNFNPTVKQAGAKISVNRCGLQLGRGPNNIFPGEIDDFAIYQYCQDVTQVLR